MNVIRRRGWEMPESRATPEHLFLDRRSFLGAAAGAAASVLAPSIASAQRVTDQPDPSLVFVEQRGPSDAQVRFDFVNKSRGLDYVVELREQAATDPRSMLPIPPAESDQ